MLTNDDITKLIQVFATKTDLEKFATKEELVELKNEVLDRMDKVFGEVKAMREDQEMHFQRHEDTDRQLKNHAGRLEKIEAITTVAHQIQNKK